ncbi:hypothetical protein [Enterococcus crotali]|uniref:hypothetical protein n=1 Tax=Enterococcus crotali TaxID=1453587 RepID=UPI0004710BB1|nr:hypothetical protein [Enterococcus crotali]
MSDFSDVISFNKFKENTCTWELNMDLSKQKNDFLENYLENYLNFLYGRSLFLVAKSGNQDLFLTVLLSMKEYRNILKIEEMKFINFDEELRCFESEKILFLNLPEDIDLSNKNNAYAILNSLENQYKVQLSNILTEYSRENLLQNFFSNATAISYICAQSYSWEYGDKIKYPVDKNKMNLISEILSLVNKFEVYDLRIFYGGDKKSFEYLIHFVLNSQLEFKQNDAFDIDIMSIMKITQLLLEIEQKKKSLNHLYKSGGTILISDNNLIIDNKFQKKVLQYFEETKDFEIDLYSGEIDEIYYLFEQKRGYSPFLLEEYLYEYDGKFLETRTIMTFIESEALVEDIFRKTRKDKAAIRLMLDDLTLKKISNDSIAKETFSNDNRLFRTPLIKIGNYYLVSFYTLLESSLYFRYRILKNHLKKGLDRNTKNLVKENFDESDLKNLEQLLIDKKVLGKVNYDLNKNSNCKKLFAKEPSIAQEIDFYYIKDNTLHLMELKNRDISRSLHGVVQSASTAEKHMKNMLKRKQFFLKNKQLFGEIFGAEFNSIQLYLVNKYPHFLDDSYNQEFQVSIFSFDTFYEYICKTL